MSRRELKLAAAVNSLSKYFGLSSVVDLTQAGLVAQSQSTEARAGVIPIERQSERAAEEGETDFARDQRQQGNILSTIEGRVRSATTDFQIDPREATLLAKVIDTSEGIFSLNSLINILNNLVSEITDPSQRQEFLKLLEIYYGPPNDPKNFYTLMEEYTRTSSDRTVPRYAQIVGARGSSTERGIIQPETGGQVLNSQLTNPTKTNPSMGVIVCNSTRISPVTRNVNATCLFLNGLPPLELSRAVPYVEVKAFFPRAPISSDNKILGSGLLKFILGGDTVSSDTSNPNYVMLQANRVTGSGNVTFPSVDWYTNAGMEMFLSPQTFTSDPSSLDRADLRANNVLDRFRPFLTLKEFKVKAVPSNGTFSYKDGEMRLMLHDRSRLSEIADFVKADLYSSNEIEVEYGWSHPDGFSLSSNRNVYGDLIDGMRMKEKFRIINSSFTVDPDGGGVDITLRLATQGGSQLNTTHVIDSSETTRNILNRIRELQELVGALRTRMFPQSGERTREVRGIQILDAFSDISPTFNLSPEQRRQLNQFRSLLNNSTAPEASGLLNALNEVFGETTARSGGSSGGSTSQATVVRELRRSVIESMRQKIGEISVLSSTDPFYLAEATNPLGPRTPGVRVYDSNPRTEQQISTDLERLEIPSVVEAGSFCSLATLLLTFIGKPLASTNNFDEIQFLFYPFNAKAGFASKITTASFLIDLQYFSQQLIRNRLQTVGNSESMSIADFMRFLQSTIIDDPTAFSYGLWDENPFFEQRRDRETQQVTYDIPDEQLPNYQTRLNQLLMNITPDGDWQMPQIELFFEALPEKTGVKDGEASTDTGKTILRIHVFDAQATCYTSEGQILRATRQEDMGALGRALASPSPTDPASRLPVSELHATRMTQAIEAAERLGLIRREQRTSSTSDSDEVRTGLREANSEVITVAGGARALKEYLYRSLPYIIFGANGTTIKKANLSSQQNSQITTINLINQRRATELLPNGQQPGGLPMQIIPSQLTIDMLGCPLISYMQQYFVDFNTGTTLDNIYAVTGFEHRFAPGEFTTSVTFTPQDGYMQYNNLYSRIINTIDQLNRYQQQVDSGETPASSPSTTAGRTRPRRQRGS